MKSALFLLAFSLSFFAFAQAEDPNGFCPRLEGIKAQHCPPRPAKDCSMTQCCGKGIDASGYCQPDIGRIRKCKKQSKMNQPKIKNGTCLSYKTVCTGTEESKVCQEVCDKYDEAKCVTEQKDCVSDCKEFEIKMNGCLCCPKEGCPEWCKGPGAGGDGTCARIEGAGAGISDYPFEGEDCSPDTPCPDKP